MLQDVPTANDFSENGVGLLDHAWDIVSNLLVEFEEALQNGHDKNDVTEEYWTAAKRKLSIAITLTQQGAEFLLKSRISEISPFILVDGTKQFKANGDPTVFSDLKTIDAYELVRVSDSLSHLKLSNYFKQCFEKFRNQRNRLQHSIDLRVLPHSTEILNYIIVFYYEFFPGKNWAKMRHESISNYPSSCLDGWEHTINRTCHELTYLIHTLPRKLVFEFFKIDKNQKRYLCPKCYKNAYTKYGFEYKLSTLRPKHPSAREVYCPVCDETHKIKRKFCNSCQRVAIFSTDYDICLSCIW